MNASTNHTAKTLTTSKTQTNKNHGHHSEIVGEVSNGVWMIPEERLLLGVSASLRCECSW
jgi:hypothetical protein